MIRKALQRLEHFGIARLIEGGYAVRTWVPALTERQPARASLASAPRALPDDGAAVLLAGFLIERPAGDQQVRGGSRARAARVPRAEIA